MPAVTLRHPSQAVPAEASLWLGWCGDSFAPRTLPLPFVHPTSPRGHLWRSPLSFPSWACKAPCPGLLGLGNERQGLKPALAPLLGSRACPSHREAVRRAGRPPALPSPSPARPPKSGLREHVQGIHCPLQPLCSPITPSASGSLRQSTHKQPCLWPLGCSFQASSEPSSLSMGSGFSGFWPPRGHIGRAEGPTWGGLAVLDSEGGFSKLSWTSRFSMRAVPRSGLSDIPPAVGSPLSSHPHHAQWNPISFTLALFLHSVYSPLLRIVMSCLLLV